jgi:hypothetical protein
LEQDEGCCSQRLWEVFKESIIGPSFKDEDDIVKPRTFQEEGSMVKAQI